MGFRFRRRIRIAPGFHINLNAKSVSVSAGVPGASLTLSREGLWGNVGIPGTGMSWRERLIGGSQGAVSVMTEPGNPASATQLDVFFQLDDHGKLILRESKEGAALSPDLRRAVMRDQKPRIEVWLEQQMAQINAETEALLRLHQDLPSLGSRVPVYQLMPFSRPKPPGPKPLPNKFFVELPPPPALSSPGILESIFTRYALAQHQNRLALMLDWSKRYRTALVSRREQLESWRQAQLDDEIELQQWQQQKQQHELQEQEKAAQFANDMRSNIEVMEAELQKQFQQMMWPRETLIDFELDEQGRVLLLDVDLPEVEHIPEQYAEWGANRNRLRIKNKTKTQRNREYSTHVHSIILRVVAYGFAVLPALERVVISGYTQRQHTETDVYVISAVVLRQQLEHLVQTDFKSSCPEELMSGWQLRVDHDRFSTMRAIEPFLE